MVSLDWKGYTWEVSEYSGYPGPGNNFRNDNVFIGEDGFLHILLKKVGNIWTVGQISTSVPLGYGTYRFVGKGRLDLIDPNIILGMFSYGGEDYINEIDIEISRWGDLPEVPQSIGWTTYPPVLGSPRLKQTGVFPMVQTSDETTHRYIWMPGYVNFLSQQGNKAESDLSDPIAAYHSVLSPNVDMPLVFIVWLMGGMAPLNDEDVDFVIEDFTFTPYVAPTAKKLVVTRDDSGLYVGASIATFIELHHSRKIPFNLCIIPHQIESDYVAYLNRALTLGNLWSVQSDVKHSGSYAMMASPGDVGGSRQKKHALGIVPTTGIIQIDYYFQADGVAQRVYGASLQGPSPWDYILPLLMDNGHFKYYNSDFHNLPVDTSYVADTWYHVQITLDFSNALMSWVIDGVSKGSVPLAWADTLAEITESQYVHHLIFWNGPSGGFAHYYDDIIVTHDGEIVFFDNFEYGDFSTASGVGRAWEDEILDPYRFEIIPCGYDADGVEDPVDVLEQARDLITSQFGKVPKSLVAPVSLIVDGFLDEAERLGYTSVINDIYFKPPRTIFMFPFSFFWENWTLSKYNTFADFKTAFDQWYAQPNQVPWYSGSNYQVFTMDITDPLLYGTSFEGSVQARLDYAAALDYILGKGDVDVVTQEDAVQILGGTGIQQMNTIFSALFESTGFTNTDGIGGAWDSAGASWSNVTSKARSGAHSAKALVSTINLPLKKNIAFDTTRQVLIDYYCQVSSVLGASLRCTLEGPVEYIEPLLMENGHFYYYDNGQKTLPVDTTYAVDTWYHVQIYLDFPNALISWVIDGVFKGATIIRCADTGVVCYPTIALSSLAFQNNGYIPTLSGSTVLFSDNFESGDFANTGGVGGAWTTVGNKWTVQTVEKYSGSYGAYCITGSGTTRMLQKTLAFDTTKQVVLDYYCRTNNVAGVPLALISGPVEMIQPLSMSGGHFVHYDTLERNLPVDTTYVADTWYHVQVYLDFPNARVSWVIDGVYKGSAELRGADTGTLIDSTIAFTTLKLYGNVSGTTYGFVDDIIVLQDVPAGLSQNDYIDDVIVKQGGFAIPAKARGLQ
jgi:hypothetical protein